ncbi:MAG: DNA repair protein RecN [Blautia sp.]|nr:DNA repair protein RecN [Blautia sp.]
MLVHLHVKNLALIEEIEVDFDRGLNILTGETGAGKSILLGSIQLILGGKVSRTMIRKDSPYALVELLFQVENEAVKKALEDMDIPLEDGQILLSRKLMDGRSINKINEETTTVGRMKETAALLLDIHGQHEHQSLLYPARQLEILDSYAGEELEKKAGQTSKAYTAYKKCLSELRSFDQDEESREREQSLLEFEIQEIEQAKVKVGEDEALEEQYRRMANSKRILEACSGIQGILNGTDGVLDRISEAGRLLRQVLDLDGQLGALSENLLQIDSLLSDFGRDFYSYIDSLSFDEEDFYRVSSRLDKINDLKAKYGGSVEAILAYQDKQAKRLEELQSYSQSLQELKQEQALLRRQLDSACRELSLARQEAGKRLSREIEEGLRDLNFANVSFSLRFDKKKSYTAQGYDELSYMIATNPGEEQKPLQEIVSGGELSRIMLALKAILADKDQIETLVFDEIDTGISGRTAQKVSEKMAIIGRNHQVLCITHLPQIAAMADVHFEIEKQAQEASARTMIHVLDEETSIRELARLLGGNSLTEAALANAREMKALAQNYKKNI